MKLRRYQKNSIEEIDQAWETHRSVMLQMPTGTGKTVIFNAIAHQKRQEGNHVLIIAHRKELVEQIAEHFKKTFNEDVGIIMSRYQEHPDKLIQVASIQTLSRRNYPFSDACFVIIDEAHHATADTYKELWEQYPDAKFLGVTATPIRLDGEGFKDLFDFLITSDSILSFIKQGYLSKYKYLGLPQVPSFLSTIKIKKDGDYDPEQLSSEMRTDKIMAHLTKSYCQYAQGKKIIVFAVNTQHSKEIVERYNSLGIRAEHIGFSTSKKERQEILEKFRTGEIRILSNVNIVTEGFDVPDCDGVQLARPTKSLCIFLQQIGRCLRLAQNKEKAIILDNVGLYLGFGLPRDERIWTLDGVKLEPEPELEPDQPTGDDIEPSPLPDEIDDGRLVESDNILWEQMEEFENIYSEIKKLGVKLLQYLQEIINGKLKEGIGTQTFEIIKYELEDVLEHLKQRKYEIAIIGAMKAGKSTFLNALIGADVLASENESCTVCLTKIKPVQPDQTPRLLEYTEEQKDPLVLAEGEAETIRTEFLKRTRQIRNTQNQDQTAYFELEHPIDAISKIPHSLSGLTLIDTPGPNEWETANFDTTILKQTALKTLRTCQAVLFIFDYTSFKDDTNKELLEDLIKNRQDFFSNSKNSGKLYFILNKVDQAKSNDRDIIDVIEDLRREIVSFGIPEPKIYSAIALQGLLAKLIQQGKATKSHKTDFNKNFINQYSMENEDGSLIIPPSHHIAPQALQDSFIPEIEESVISKIIETAGWNFLREILGQLNQFAQAIEECIEARIQGWTMSIEKLENIVGEYKVASDSAQEEIKIFKHNIGEKKKKYIYEFSQEMDNFQKIAKQKISDEIDKLAHTQSQSNQSRSRNKRASLVEKLQYFLKRKSSHNLYKIKCDRPEEVEQIYEIINRHCTPIIHSFWLDTQDKLIRKGQEIRADLVHNIQSAINKISNTIRKFLNEKLAVELKPNYNSFPQFKFLGIDAQIDAQINKIQDSITELQTKVKKRSCKSDLVYEVPYQKTITYYEVDLQSIKRAFETTIDAQVEESKKILKKVMTKQIEEDLNDAQKQIDNYINEFQIQFDEQLNNRNNRKKLERMEVPILEQELSKIIEIINELNAIRENKAQLREDDNIFVTN